MPETPNTPVPQVQAPADLASNSLPTRPKNAKGHKSSCTCKLCAKIQAAIASGKPTKAEARAIARAKRITEARAKERATKAAATAKAKSLTMKQQEDIAKAAVVEGVVAGQIAAGVRPSLAKAAEIAGVSMAKARDIAGNDIVQSSLEKNGITLDLLDEVGKDGLKATNNKLVFDQDGNVVDNIELPDHHARHKFWRDYNMMHGRLGEKDERGGSGGGLIIIAPQEAKVLEGHAPACVCEKCVEAWNIKTRVLSRRAANAMAIDADLVENKNALPESLPVDPFEEDDEG